MRNSMKRSEMQRLIAIVCLAGSLLCLGGCEGGKEAACSPKDGGSSAGGPSEASAKVYGIERELSIGLNEKALSNCFATEDNIYYMQDKKGTGGVLLKRELAAQAKPVQLLAVEENEMLQAFSVSKQGEIFAAVKRLEMTDDNEVNENSGVCMELWKTDKEGELLWKMEIPDTQATPFISHILEGSDGRLYAASDRELFCFEETGELVKCVTVKGELISQLSEAGEGKAAVLQESGKGQSLTVYQGENGKEMLHKDFRSSKSWLKEPENLYYREGDRLIAYDWEKDSSEEVFSFTASGIEAFAVRIFKALGEERYLLGLEEEGIIRFVWLSSQAEQAEEEQEGEDKPIVQLTFALYNEQGFQGSVVSFNQTHKNSELTMKTFVSVEQEGQYNAYLASKDGPDIVEVSGRQEDYISNGYLQDLTPFIEKSDKINWEDFIDRLPEDIVVGGKIYALPRTMSVTALACPADILEGKTSWTIDEYLDLLEQYPDAMSWKGFTAEEVKDYILRCALSNGINGFINQEEERCFLDGEYLRSVLERIAALDVKTTNKSFEARAREGEVVFQELYLNNATMDLQKAEALSGRELVLIGFPVSGKIEGEKSSNHISYDYMVGLHSGTKHAEEAWEYVEAHFLSALKTNSFYFTPGRTAFEEKLGEHEGEDLLTVDENWEVVTGPPLTREQKEKVRNAYLEATVYRGEEFKLIGMIAEEAEPYFKGDKELDDVVEIILNRVQLYLDEKG